MMPVSSQRNFDFSMAGPRSSSRPQLKSPFLNPGVENLLYTLGCQTLDSSENFLPF